MAAFTTNGVEDSVSFHCLKSFFLLWMLRNTLLHFQCPRRCSDVQNVPITVLFFPNQGWNTQSHSNTWSAYVWHVSGPGEIHQMCDPYCTSGKYNFPIYSLSLCGMVEARRFSLSLIFHCTLFITVTLKLLLKLRSLCLHLKQKLEMVGRFAGVAADLDPPGPNPPADMDPPSQIWAPLPNFPIKHLLYHIW